MGFVEAVTDAARNAPLWLQVLIIVLVALLPFIEMRGAVPIALICGWHIGPAILLTAPVSLLPGLLIVFYLPTIEPRLRKVALFNRLLDRAFAWTRKKAKTPEDQKKRDKRATIFLALLVAIPGPGTGAWTGGLFSYVFEVPKRKALWALGLGVLGEAVAIYLIWLFLDRLF